MRGVVLRSVAEPPYSSSRPLTIEDLPVPSPRGGEVRLRIVLASLCHSDLSVVDGSRPRPLPMLLGHESVAVVDAVGDGVTSVAVGDRVVTLFVPSCGSCRECASGRPALCSAAAIANGDGRLLHGPALLRSADGEQIHHHLGVSCFAEYAVVSEESVVVVPADVPVEVAAMLGCAVLTGMGSVLRTGRLRSGEGVAVFGLGAVGLAAIMAARVAGASVVIGVDPVVSKHSIALAAGATHVVTPDQLASSNALSDATVDLAVEAVGSARVIESAFDLVTRGGRVVSVGLPHPQQQLQLPALEFAGAGKSLLGSYMGDAVPSEDIPHYLSLWRDGRLPLELLHTDTRPLSDINQALDDLRAGRVVRRLMQPDD